jgi:DNA modification methylase
MEVIMSYPVNEIICGDCVEVMKDFPADSIDLVVTSPPYDNLRDYKGFTFNFEAIAQELYRIIKLGGVVVWVVGDQTIKFCESLSSFKQAIYFVENCGFNLLDTMIYHKTNYPPAYPSIKRYANTFEYMFVFVRQSPKTFNAIRTLRVETPDGGTHSYRQKDGSLKKKIIFNSKKTKESTNVWELCPTRAKDSGDHPAIFPEILAENHIITWSNPGDIVLDPMCGSGTTCKMALKHGRKYIGIDTSPEYCDLAVKRISAKYFLMAGA